MGITYLGPQGAYLFGPKEVNMGLEGTYVNGRVQKEAKKYA